MTYRTYAGFGADGSPVPVTPAAVPVSTTTPPYSQQALALMGVAALPWIPVVAGAWIGNKLIDDGKIWGALGGGLISFLVIRHSLKQLGGAISVT